MAQKFISSIAHKDEGIKPIMLFLRTICILRWVEKSNIIDYDMIKNWQPMWDYLFVEEIHEIHPKVLADSKVHLRLEWLLSTTWI